MYKSNLEMKSKLCSIDLNIKYINYPTKFGGNDAFSEVILF